MKAGHKNGDVEEYTASGKPDFSKYLFRQRAEWPGIFNDYQERFTREFSYANDTVEGLHTEKWMNGLPKTGKQLCKRRL